VRFVAQDSDGQCYLWSLRWGQAGYSCRSVRLTSFEAECLYTLLSQGKHGELASILRGVWRLRPFAASSFIHA
jgi:hypothetical protein